MKHTVIIDQRPKRTGKHSTPDGAICGNGDVSVILGEHENGLSCYIAKSDYWFGSENVEHSGGIKPVGVLKIDVPSELYDNYHVEQRMDKGGLFCRFSDGKNCVEVLIFVSRNGNSVWVETTWSKGMNVNPARFSPFGFSFATIEENEKDGAKLYSIEFKDNELVFETSLDIAFEKAMFENRSVCVLSLSSGFDEASLQVQAMSEEAFKNERLDNQKRWADFYGKSSFRVADSTLEMNWYNRKSVII